MWGPWISGEEPRVHYSAGERERSGRRPHQEEEPITMVTMVNPGLNMGDICNLHPSTMVTQFTIMAVPRPFEDLPEVNHINLVTTTITPSLNNTVQPQPGLFLVIYKLWLIP